MITNLDYLNELSDGSEEFIKDIVGTFVEETPENLERIQQALLIGDYATIGIVAHKIKPSMTFFGIAELEDDIKELEQNANTLQNLDQIPAQVEKLNRILNLALIELKAVL